MTANESGANSTVFEELAAKEKLQYMHDYAKASTVATVLAPLLCIPLYIDTTEPTLFYAWCALMALVVLVRLFLIRSIHPDNQVQHNLTLLNVAVGIVTFAWGLGWFIFVPTSEPVEYLLYQIISLTILFVGMVGYCVNWKTFFSFVLPLKVPELLYVVFHHQVIIWPIALGSMVAFYLALKMGFLFSKSWEKSFSLRLKNDALIDQLVAEKNASNEANLAKSEFIATASHDLRQPMQSINIFIDMIDPATLNDYERSIFIRMRNSVSVLNKMFSTLLDINKLDTNFVPIETEFSLTQIVSELKDAFSDLCAQKGLGLCFNYTDCIVTGDNRLIEQVLRNLLSNAIQYTDQGEITVTFDCQQHQLMFTVEDSGCGIPADDLSLVFNEFYRSEHSRSRYDGLGLGLSIVNRIARKIGGECTVTSEVGKGSVFRIQTPYLAQEAPSGLTIQFDSGKSSHVHLADSQRMSPPQDSAKPVIHIGIIENDMSLKDAYQQYFTHAGYKVFLIPYQEQDFLTYLLEIPRMDFILSDFRLSDKNGIHFIQRLREEFNDDIPACIVTADTSPSHLELFSQHHIHVLYKPMDIKAIEKFISEFFSKQPVT